MLYCYRTKNCVKEGVWIYRCGGHYFDLQVRMWKKRMQSPIVDFRLLSILNGGTQSVCVKYAWFKKTKKTQNTGAKMQQRWVGWVCGYFPGRTYQKKCLLEISMVWDMWSPGCLTRIAFAVTVQCWHNEFIWSGIGDTDNHAQGHGLF